MISLYWSGHTEDMLGVRGGHRGDILHAEQPDLLWERLQGKQDQHEKEDGQQKLPVVWHSVRSSVSSILFS